MCGDRCSEAFRRIVKACCPCCFKKKRRTYEKENVPFYDDRYMEDFRKVMRRDCLRHLCNDSPESPSREYALVRIVSIVQRGRQLGENYTKHVSGLTVKRDYFVEGCENERGGPYRTLPIYGVREEPVAGPSHWRLRAHIPERAMLDLPESEDEVTTSSAGYMEGADVSETSSQAVSGENLVELMPEEDAVRFRPGNSLENIENIPADADDRIDRANIRHHNPTENKEPMPKGGTEVQI